MINVDNILRLLEDKFPINTASEFDKGKIGLQFGNPDAIVKKVMITLDVTSEVIDEAINHKVDLIISHHPFMFTPLLNLNYTSVLGRNLKKIFSNDLNIIAMHTNYDLGKGGLNDILIKKLGFQSIEENVCDIVPNHFVRTFTVNDMTGKELINLIQNKFAVKVVRTVGDLNKPLKLVGMVAGGGASDMYSAQKIGVDCYISGEFHHNNAIDALENNLVLIELPHAVENLGLDSFFDLLNQSYPCLEIIKSNHKADPFDY